jgi:hypothetical protein
MQSSTSQLVSKAFKIEKKDSSAGVWLYFNEKTQSFDPTLINNIPSYVGELQDTPMTPAIIFIGQNYPNLSFAMDFLPGSNSTVSSERNGVLSKSISKNNLNVSYTPMETTDIFKFTLYSADNSIKKIIFKNITIDTIDVIPTYIEGNPTINTLNNLYTGLTMNFFENVDAGTVTTFSSESSVSNVIFSNGKCSFDYRTPTTHTSDKIIFTNLRNERIQVINKAPQNFELTNLKLQPSFSSWLLTPASQNFSYINTDSLSAIFTKDIRTCTSITASSGSPTTIIPDSIIGNKINFEWSSLNTGNVTFTFNGLVSIDGSIDANVDGLTTVGPVILNTPATITGWTGVQPNEPFTMYNVSVTFTKQLSTSRTPLITSSDTSNPVFTSISGSQVNFTVTTSSNPNNTIYTFSNVKALDGSIKNGATISTGAKIDSVQVETDITGSDSYVTMSKLVKLRSQKVKIFLSKPIVGILSLVTNLNCTFGAVTMITSSIAEFKVTPFDNGISLTIQSDNIICEDNSQSTISHTFDLVYSQTVLNLFETLNRNSSKTTFDVGIDVALSLEVSNEISSDFLETSITSPNGIVTNLSHTIDFGRYYYTFNFTPTYSGTDQTIYVNKAKDLNGFKYNILKSGLIFVNVYNFPTDFLYESSSILKENTSGSLTLTFSGGDSLHSNIVTNQIVYVKYLQGNSETTIPFSMLRCAFNLQTITILSITPTQIANLTIKVKLLSPNGVEGPEITKIIPMAEIVPQWVPSSAGSVISNVLSPYKLIVGSENRLVFSFISTANFPVNNASNLFSLRIDTVLTSLNEAIVNQEEKTISILHTTYTTNSKTFVFTTNYGTNYSFTVLSSEIYTFPTMNSTTHNVSIITLGQTLNLLSLFSEDLPSNMNASVSITPTGLSTFYKTPIIYEASVTYSFKVEQDVLHAGTVTLIYGEVHREYTWSLTETQIYSFPSSFTYNGINNNFGSGFHLRSGVTSSLTLTFFGGDMLYSSIISSQVSYVKIIQDEIETTIAHENLECSDPLETITILSLLPSSNSDLTIKVKLVGPDTTLSSEIYNVVTSAHIAPEVIREKPIYKIDSITKLKTSGYSNDSNYSSLIVAFPGDSTSDISHLINTLTNTKTLVFTNGYVTSNTFKYYGSSYSIRTPGTGWPQPVSSSFKISGFSTNFFNSNFTLESWFRPTLPSNPSNTSNTFITSGPLPIMTNPTWYYPFSSDIKNYASGTGVSDAVMGVGGNLSGGTASFSDGGLVLTGSSNHNASGASYVVLPSTSSGSTASFCCWFKSNNNSHYTRIIDMATNGTFRLYIAGSNSLNFNDAFTMNTSTPINNNTWNFIAINANGSTFSWVLNGGGTGNSGSGSLSKPVSFSNSVGYLGHSFGWDPEFAGTLKEVRFFANQNVSLQEISYLYTGSTLAIHCDVNATTGGRFLISNNVSQYYTNRVFNIDTWNHMALVRNVNSFTLYVNGNSELTFPSWTFPDLTYLCVGGLNIPNYEHQDFYGQIQDLRVYTTVKYNANFSVS